MSLQFQIDAKSGVPRYIQIMDQMRYLIATGKLSPGDQLPTIRELAIDLIVNPNTVARAYSELEREGLLVTQQGRGTFVLERQNKEQLARLGREKLSSIIEEAMVSAANLGYSLAEIEECMADQVRRWKNQSQD